MTAALYWLLTLSVSGRIDESAMWSMRYRLSDISYLAIRTALDSPLTLLLIALIITGFLFFTDTHSTWYRIIMGGLHAIAHILTAFAIAFVTVSFVAQIAMTGDWHLHVPWPGGFHFDFDLRLLLASLMIMIGGFVFGPLIMGSYLLLSLNVFGRHGNEAFSSLALQDWKNFLRLHINENGDLTIYPIGIRRVPRKWKPRTSESGPEWVPDPEDSKATEPELIEAPIVMQAARTKTGVQTTSPEKIDASTQSSTPS